MQTNSYTEESYQQMQISSDNPSYIVGILAQANYPVGIIKL